MPETSDVVAARRQVFISGPPGAGKSTISRLVAEKFDRSVYIDADFIRESIVSGFEQPTLPPFTEGSVQQAELQRDIVVTWAERLARAGYVPVVDDAPIPSPRLFASQYASLWSDPGTDLVMLLPDAEEVRRRIGALRAERGAGEDHLGGPPRAKATHPTGR